MASEVRSALLVDWGGVLTTNLFASFGEFCNQAGLAPDTLVQAFRGNRAFRDTLILFEEGKVEEPVFEERFGALLGVDHVGLIDRLFARVGPDMAMLAAVRNARAAGVRTGLISNSWGTRRYDRAMLEELFDGVVISGEEGTHKPEPGIYLLGAERVGLEPADCVFVDDLRENCAGAEAVGMTAVLHRGADSTIPELERLLGLSLAPSS
jgi:putative hydrolase of the HAD superfamily